MFRTAIVILMSFEKQSESIPFSGIASEIKQMVAVDQVMRERSQEDDFWDEEIDARNTERMQEIVAEIGLPTISKVGKEGVSNAWLLVQHADHDVEFQKQYLHLMKEAPVNEVDQTDIAYLEDRMRVNQGKEQLYGTQFMQKNNQHIPKMIENQDKVDERRAELGMGPLSEQVQLMYERYPFKPE